MITTLSTIEDFYRTLENDPDPMARVVFADWLEEQGDKRAELLRRIHRLNEANISGWTIQGYRRHNIFHGNRLKIELRKEYALDLANHIFKLMPISFNQYTTIHSAISDIRENGVGLSDLYFAINQISLIAERVRATQVFHALNHLELNSTNRNEWASNMTMDAIVQLHAEQESGNYRESGHPPLYNSDECWRTWEFAVCRLFEYRYFDRHPIWTNYPRRIREFMSNRIPNGTTVQVTVDPTKISSGWTQEALKARKPAGIHTGYIRCHHDSHGLCYEVTFPDGSTSCYDPHEVKPLQEVSHDKPQSP